MHVLIVDALPPETQVGLQALGLDVTVNTTLGSHSLPQAVTDIDIIVTSSTRVTRRTIEAASQLKLVVVAGSSADTVDVTAASERGVFVSHCARAESSARAELIVGLLLALDRGLSHPLPTPSAGASAGLRGRSLGIYGWDSTAERLRDIAAGLGLRVHAFDPGLTTALASEAEVHQMDSADALFAGCDLVSLHPTPTDGGPIVTAERVRSLPVGATLINTARRGLIDLEAARERLAAGELRLALDVYDADDYGDDVPFSADAFPGALIATTSVAARTQQANDAIASAVLERIEAFLLTQRVPDCVNLDADASEVFTLVVRYRPDPGVLASLFAALRDAEVAVSSVETSRFVGGASALVRMTVARPPSPSLVTAITRHPGVIRLDQR